MGSESILITNSVSNKIGCKHFGHKKSIDRSKNMISAILVKKSCGVRGARQLSVKFRPQYGAFINGKEVFPESKEFFKVYAPATDEVLCEVASTDKKALDDAVNAADKVYQSGVWSRSDVRYRADVLSKIAVNLREAVPELLELEVAQTGRAVREMKAQVFIKYLSFLEYHLTVYNIFLSWDAFQSGSTTSLHLFAPTRVHALHSLEIILIMYIVFLLVCVVLSPHGITRCLLL